MYDYNTTRVPLILKEYGRNVQRLVEQLREIEDKAMRTQKAYAIVKLMEILNPNAEFSQKRWDDLFTLADCELQVEGPYPKPDPKPKEDVQHYASAPHADEVRSRYYGRNMEVLIQKVAAVPPGPEQQEKLLALVKLMRKFSNVWHNDCISIERVIQDIRRMLPAGAPIDLEIVRSMPEEHPNGNGPKNTTYPQNKPTHSCPKKRENKGKMTS